MHSLILSVPSLDASQDWELQGASEEGGFTTIQFERRLDTCDEEDLPVNFVSYVLLPLCTAYMHNSVWACMACIILLWSVVIGFVHRQRVQ